MDYNNTISRDLMSSTLTLGIGIWERKSWIGASLLLPSQTSSLHESECSDSGQSFTPLWADGSTMNLYLCVVWKSLLEQDNNIALWRLDDSIVMGTALIIRMYLTYLLPCRNNPKRAMKGLLLFVERMWRPFLFALLLTTCMEPEFRYILTASNP